MDIITLPKAINSLDQIEAIIFDLGSHEPHKGYLIGKYLEKLAKRATTEFSDGFKSYYDEQKELPGGFSCKITNRSTYCFEENEEYAIAKANLEFLETQIKQATDSNVEFPNPRSGLYIKGVTKKSSEVYVVTKK